MFMSKLSGLNLLFQNIFHRLANGGDIIEKTK
jgi:hypothetical protein